MKSGLLLGIFITISFIVLNVYTANGAVAPSPSVTETENTPSSASTSTNNSNVTGATGSETGLVKCGVSRDCTLCDIFILIRDIFVFALQLLASLAVLSIVVGGVYMIISNGNSSTYQQGVEIISNAIIGLLLVMASFLLFSFMLTALGFQSANFSAVFNFQAGQFFEVKCDSAATFNSGGTSGGGTGLPSTEAGACGTKRCGDSFGVQIKAEANKVGVDPKLLQALIDTENANGTNCATDKIRNEDDGTQSCGLYQLNTGGALAECGISCQEALDVNKNIACAAKYLKDGNATTACAAAHRWNPGACSASCVDLNFQYCSRNVANYDFYNKCTAN